MKALYIEDNPTTIMMVTEMLRGTCDVIGACSGEEGLQKIDELAPDIIILDINLPGMNGFQVLDQLRRQEAYDEIPVIALTSRVIYGKHEQSMADRFNAYLIKPFMRSKLVGALAEHLQ